MGGRPGRETSLTLSRTSCKHYPLKTSRVHFHATSFTKFHVKFQDSSFLQQTETATIQMKVTADLSTLYTEQLKYAKQKNHF